MIDLLPSFVKEVDFETNVPLSEHTSFGIGGPAALFARIGDEASLSLTLKAASKLNIDVLILGSGTNLLVSDDGFPGLVIQIDFKDIKIDETSLLVSASAGVSTSDLVELLINKGIKGLEFAAGLPGTVGGAIAGNAGCFGHCLSDFLSSAAIVKPNGEILEVNDMSWFDFCYRGTALSSERAVLTKAVFKLELGNRDELRAESAKYLNVRKTKHPQKGMRTAGSYFKNLPPSTPGGTRTAAGALLDQAGVHGLSVGDAAVFEHHANIIVNRGHAKAKDVLQLASKMASLVKTRFGVDLEEEVRFVGNQPKGF